jgi:hypothetical protein
MTGNCIVTCHDIATTDNIRDEFLILTRVHNKAPAKFRYIYQEQQERIREHYRYEQYEAFARNLKYAFSKLPERYTPEQFRAEYTYIKNKVPKCKGHDPKKISWVIRKYKHNHYLFWEDRKFESIKETAWCYDNFSRAADKGLYHKWVNVKVADYVEGINIKLAIISLLEQKYPEDSRIQKIVRTLKDLTSHNGMPFDEYIDKWAKELLCRPQTAEPRWQRNNK